MLDNLKRQVLAANQDLPKYNLVTFTWGNVSGFDAEDGLIVIKPSGMNYGDMRVEDLVVVDLEGKVVEGHRNPSSDTPTHVELYKKYPDMGGIVHTHSNWATVWAQAGKPIPALGTTHADYFYGDILCTRPMRKDEVESSYEENTGRVILETLTGLNPADSPGILIHGHGPFCWGSHPANAVHNAVVLETVAMMAYHTLQLNSSKDSLDQFLLDKHFKRKHGPKAYYGQQK